MIDKLQPRQIFSLDDQSSNCTPGHQRIIAMYKPITIIHENSIIAHEFNISSMKTRKSLTLVDRGLASLVLTKRNAAAGNEIALSSSQCPGNEESFSSFRMGEIGKISNFLRLLHEISEDLITEDVKQLKFLCDDGTLTKARLEKIENAKDFFVAIREVIEDETKQLNFLKDLFKTISRNDVKAKIDKFQESRKGRHHGTFVKCFID